MAISLNYGNIYSEVKDKRQTDINRPKATRGSLENLSSCRLSQSEIFCLYSFPSLAVSNSQAQGTKSLSVLRSSISSTSPSVSKILDWDKLLRSDHSAPELKKRGREFLNRVYSRVADRVQEDIALSSGGEDPQHERDGLVGVCGLIW